VSQLAKLLMDEKSVNIKGKKAIRGKYADVK